MAQNYQDIPATQTLSSSRPLLLDRDAAAASNFSGSAFPTSNLLVGMRCHRTDLNKVYALKTLTPSATWVEVEDLSGSVGAAPRAAALVTARNFSVSGDVATASAVSFDGSADVALSVSLATVAGLTPGTYSKVTVNAKGQVTVGGNITGADLPADLTPATLRVTGTGAASLASTGHGFQIGPDAGINLIADQNDIQVRNAGAAGQLNLNPFGGNIAIGTTGVSVTVPGTLAPTAITLPANSVGSANIVDGAVATAKIADGAVTAAKLAAGAAAADSANVAYSGVGAYILGAHSGNITVSPGNTTAGSNLTAACITYSNGTTLGNLATNGTARAGTWRAMGHGVGSGGTGGFGSIGLWLRIA